MRAFTFPKDMVDAMASAVRGGEGADRGGGGRGKAELEGEGEGEDRTPSVSNASDYSALENAAAVIKPADVAFMAPSLSYAPGAGEGGGIGQFISHLSSLSLLSLFYLSLVSLSLS